MGPGAAGRLRESGLRLRPGLWFQGRAAPGARQPRPQAREPAGWRQAWTRSRPEWSWHWPLEAQFERGSSLVLCFGGTLGRGVPRPEVLCAGPAWTQWKARCRPGPRAGLAALPLSQDLGLFALLAVGPLSRGQGSRVPSTGRSLSKGGRRQPFRAGAPAGRRGLSTILLSACRSALPGSRPPRKMGPERHGVPWPHPEA